ncbi:MAG: glycosyltransferase [Pseudomonadota bacterium]
MAVLAGLSLITWIILVFFRGGFWKADQVLPAAEPPSRWPSVTVIIPARDEAASIRRVVAAHRGCDYPGDLRIVVSDDASSDGTTAEATAAEGAFPAEAINVPPLAEGWTGKLWALNAGLEHAEGMASPPEYILLTDADIVVAPDLTRKLVAAAERKDLALVSIMAQLDASQFWGGTLVPAFIYFFQKLYPFPLINKRSSAVAGAAGGVVLVRKDALDAIGGIGALRGALIDDCTLAQKIKAHAPGTAIGLFLSSPFAEAISLRDNSTYKAMELMVARTAFAQLRHNAGLLLGTLFGLGLVYLVPPAAVLGGPLHNDPRAFWLGLAAWALMIVSYAPTLGRYGKSRREAFMLPFAATVYGWLTWLSAWRHWRGKGNVWKGRSY